MMTRRNNNTNETERTWPSVGCLLFGHDWVGHTTYKLESDTGRALYGDLCETCGKFQPRENGKERFDNPKPTSFKEAIREGNLDPDTEQ